jgi:nitrate reductase assembly molybdenum cofactor insertion protein NarJ
VKNYAHYKLLMGLFSYPDSSFRDKVSNIIKFFPHKYHDSIKQIKKFYNLVALNDVLLMEELYIRTFNVQAITTLDLGYVLFGDDYKRGEILVNLNQEHRKVKINCGYELGDYLPNVLLLISRSPDADFLKELVKMFLAPALRKMISEFDQNKIKRRESFYRKQYKTLIFTNETRIILYKYALGSIYSTLSMDFDINIEKQYYEKSVDFLSNLEVEFQTEKNEDI